MTLAEFLEWDDGTDRRDELLDGVPVMMASSLQAHGELVATLTIEIGSRLSPPCRVISEAGSWFLTAPTPTIGRISP